MRLLFDFEEVSPYIFLLESDIFPIIDMETMVDYIVASFITGIENKESVLAQCVDSISSVGKLCDDDNSFQKLINGIFNLICKVFEALSHYPFAKNIPRHFVDTKTHRVWRNLYVIEFCT
jgi:hypothetical protein